MKEIFNKLALVTMLAGSVLSFNSCGDKEQIHGGNPVEDQCVHCDDEKNDNSCVNGSECGYGYTDERLHTIGNGNYQFRNFMYENGFVDEKVKNSLNDAKSHINVLLGNFSDSFKNNYSDAFVLVKENGAFELDNSAGIDYTINRINISCKPFIIDIAKNINNPIDQKRLIVYYQNLDTHAERKGYGNEFDSNNEDYNQNIEEAQRRWTNWNTEGKPFDITYDGNGLTHDSAVNITNDLDRILNEAATNIGNGMTQADLRNIINISFTASSLDAVHDFTAASLHKNCVKSTESILDALVDTVRNLQTQEQSLQQTR